jgi:hypothetical protein
MWVLTSQQMGENYGDYFASFEMGRVGGVKEDSAKLCEQNHKQECRNQFIVRHIVIGVAVCASSRY